MKNEWTVNFVAFFTAEKSDVRFVIADLDGERRGFAPADVRRIADDEVEEK